MTAAIDVTKVMRKSTPTIRAVFRSESIGIPSIGEVAGENVEQLSLGLLHLRRRE
jgi:hypothetical protein